MRVAALAAVLLVGVPAGVLAWADAHQLRPPEVRVGLDRFSHAVSCIYANRTPVAGCTWTSYAGTRPTKLVLLRVEAAGCTRRGEGFVCELPDGMPCSIVVGRPTPCISALAVKTGR